MRLVVVFALLASSAFALPNLVSDPTNITFSVASPTEFQLVLVNATVFNIGDAAANGIVINLTESNVSIGNITTSIPAGGNATVNGSYIAKAGRRIIEVRPDAFSAVAESNEGDNNATQNITVPAYQVFFGNLSSREGIGINNSFLADFGLNGVKNVFVVDSDSVINFARLAPLGRKNNSVSVATRDFEDADINLNMSTFNDSINFTFSIDGTNPRNNASFLIFESLKANVSFVNSTNSSSFLTGILWDASDSLDDEYDTTEEEDLVFFTAVNASSASKFGIVDYELRLPSLLRQYTGSSQTVALYLEPR
ncbi:hypothetical protein HY641_05170 [Candidatus Woesearchaeota archaeon]|nr:hypothetical protein [Candidatus Woesearchaeota archaeon]